MIQKIYIITIHHIANFGSQLQAYALQKFLTFSGMKSEIIDYRPRYYRFGRNIIKSLVKSLIFARSNRKIKEQCDVFLHKYIQLTPKSYFKAKQLKKFFSNEGDIFIAGGDQLWNSYHPCGKDASYKLSFVRNRRKIAYGTSIGRNNLSKKEIANLVLEISDFSSIGLRESSTVKMLDGYGLANLYNAVDPVLLLDICEYKLLMKEVPVQEPYVLFYMIKNSDIIDDMVYRARFLNMKIIQVGGRKAECEYDSKFLELSTNEMLGLINKASCIVSNSYHATVFSVMLNKPFYALLPNVNTNARIEDFLRNLDLHNLIIRRRTDIGSIPPNIDYLNVNKILSNHIRKSKNHLLTAILGNSTYRDD